jgi:hypothetical protein
LGIDLAVGAAAMSGAAMVAAAFPGVPIRLGVMAVATAVYAALVENARAGLATAGLGYLVFNGFLVNRFGELTWNGMNSIRHAAVLAAAAGVGLGFRCLRRPPTSIQRWRRRSRTVPDLVFVLVTVGLFAVLALVVRGVERL